MILSIATTSLYRATTFCVARRSMSTTSSGIVANLSDLDAVEKFTQLNPKCVLYYTASWCGPCRQIKPIYAQAAKDFEGIGFGLIDVDENADAAAAAQIAAVPTFIAYNDRTPIEKFSGADPNKLADVLNGLKSK